MKSFIVFSALRHGRRCNNTLAGIFAKQKFLSLISACLLILGSFSLASCSGPTESADLSALALLGGGFNINKLAAGLYTGTPFSLRANSTPIGTVAANDITAAFNYVNDTTNPDEQYTLLISEDVNAVEQTLNTADRDLTIIGIGEERTIQYNGPVGGRLLEVRSGTNLTLGNNITLKGLAAGAAATAALVYVDGSSDLVNLVLLAGSKITGHSTSADATVLITGIYSDFIIKGGEITGNHSSSANTAASGGVLVTGDAAFDMSGGRITGNTKGATIEDMDVYINLTPKVRKTGGTIGVSYPAALATQPTYP